MLSTVIWGNVSINVMLTLLSSSVLAGLSAFFFSAFAITLLGEILRCRPKCGWNYNWHNLRETNYSILCGEFKWLIDGRCGKAFPAIDFAHVDLTGSKQRPEQHGSRVRRRQHGLRLDPALELLV